MTNEQFYALVLRKARRPGDPTLNALLPDEMRQMLQSLERSPFHPWFLETTSSGLVTVADTQTIDMPTDFLLFVEDTRVELESDEGKFRVERWYLEAIEDQYDDEATGLPVVYDLFQNKLYFGPTPDQEYNVLFRYYAKTLAPDADDPEEVTNVWFLNAEDFIVTLAAYRLVDFYVKDDKRARSLNEEAARLRSELHKYNEARKHSDMDYRITD